MKRITTLCGLVAVLASFPAFAQIDFRIPNGVLFRDREAITIDATCIFGEKIEVTLPAQLTLIENKYFSECQPGGWFYLRFKAHENGTYQVSYKQAGEEAKRTIVVRQLDEVYSVPKELNQGGMYMQRQGNRLVVQDFKRAYILDISRVPFVKQLDVNPEKDAATGERALMVYVHSDYAYVYRVIRKDQHEWLPSVAIDVYALNEGSEAKLIKRVPSQMEFDFDEHNTLFNGFREPRLLPMLSHQRGNYLYAEATERDVFNWHYVRNLYMGLDLTDPHNPREISFLVSHPKGYQPYWGSLRFVGNHALSLEKNDKGLVNLVVHEIRPGKLEWPVVARHTIFSQETVIGEKSTLSSKREQAILKHLESPDRKAFVIRGDGRLYEFDGQNPTKLTLVNGVPAIGEKDWEKVPSRIAIYKDMYFYSNHSYDDQWQYDHLGTTGLVQGTKFYQQGYLGRELHHEMLVHHGCLVSLTPSGVNVHSGLPNTHCTWP
jgi:hypothetical protein